MGNLEDMIKSAAQGNREEGVSQVQLSTTEVPIMGKPEILNYTHDREVSFGKPFIANEGVDMASNMRTDGRDTGEKSDDN